MESQILYLLRVCLFNFGIYKICGSVETTCSCSAFCIIHNSIIIIHNFSHVLLICFDLQYIHPADAVKLGQAELLVIDEAAAIPLPLVKKLLGPYLVFMASTINGSVFEELLGLFTMV